MHSAPQSPRSNLIFLAGYGCATAAGDGVGALWNGLVEGRDHSRSVDTSGWTAPIPSMEAPPLVCSFPQTVPSHRERLVRHLQKAFSQTGFQPRGAYAVIFASSKGCLDDFVWTGDENTLRGDPYTPVLEDFLRAERLTPQCHVTVSNACASAHGAIFLAQRWLQVGRVRDVLVLAADGVGPFVLHGFRSLGALSNTRCRPFAANRDGLRLGEAAGALWLSSEKTGETRLEAVAIETEGYAVTRSSENGVGLRSALRQTGEGAPSVVVAHGTGTVANDRVEDRVLFEAFADQTPITGTKWSVGHTLGASGLVDTIAAAEALRHKRGFALHNTASADPKFRARYWTAQHESFALPTARSAVVTSLGFGGMNAAVRLEVV